MALVSVVYELSCAVTTKTTTSFTLFSDNIDSSRSSSSYDNNYPNGVDDISFTAISMTTATYVSPSYDIDTESSAVSVADEATFCDIDASVTVTMTTQVYSSSSSSLPSELSIKYVIFSAVVNAVTSTTTSYVPPSSYNNDRINNNDGSNDEYMDVFDSTDITKMTRSLFHNGGSFTAIYESYTNTIASSMNTAIYFAVIDADSSADITKTTTSSSQPSTASAITLKTYNTVYNLYFDTVYDGRTGYNDFDLYFDTIFDGRISGSNGSFGRVTKITASYDSSNNQPSYDNNNNKFDSFSALFHIIDQGSVLYLIRFQILLYNQQYVYDDGYNYSLSCVSVSVFCFCCGRSNGFCLENDNII